MRPERSIIAWNTSATLGSMRSAMTSIHGWLSAAGPMNRTGAVFARRGARPTRSAGYAITALASSSVMRCARALDRITIITHKVYDNFVKVQYTFTRAHVGVLGHRYRPNRPVRSNGSADRSPTAGERHKGIHLLGHVSAQGERGALPPFLQLLDHEPLRFEDFEAQDRSSREACLAGFEAAEVYVLLLGPRCETPFSDSGLSPTAEEFRRARQRGIPILVFNKTTDEKGEPAQVDFNNEVGHYVNGRLWRSFADPTSCNQAVGEALKAPNAERGPIPRTTTVPWFERDPAFGGRNSGKRVRRWAQPHGAGLGVRAGARNPRAGYRRDERAQSAADRRTRSEFGARDALHRVRVGR